MTGFKQDRVTREFEDERDNEEEGTEEGNGDGSQDGSEDELDNDDHGEQTEEGEEQTVVGQEQDGSEGVKHDAYVGVEMNEAPVEQRQAAQAPQANNQAKKNDNETLRGEIKALDTHFQSRLNCVEREQKDIFASIIDGIRAIQATVGIPVVDPHTARPQ